MTKEEIAFIKDKIGFDCSAGAVNEVNNIVETTVMVNSARAEFWERNYYKLLEGIQKSHKRIKGEKIEVEYRREHYDTVLMAMAMSSQLESLKFALSVIEEECPEVLEQTEEEWLDAIKRNNEE